MSHSWSQNPSEYSGLAEAGQRAGAKAVRVGDSILIFGRSGTPERTLTDLTTLALDLPGGLDPAALHGIVCGVACSLPEGGSETRLRAIAETLGSDTAHLHGAAELAGFVAAAEMELWDSNFAFAPLLPDDEEAMAHRIDALSHWCVGFVRAFTAQVDLRALPELSVEALTDVTRIAQVTDEADAANELDYLSVVEHLKVAVLLLRDPLQRNESPGLDERTERNDDEG